VAKFADSEGAPKSVEALDLTEKVVSLRASGANFREIARALDISVSTAHSLLHKAIAQRREELGLKTDELVEVEVARCDQLQLAVWPKAIKGDTRAIAAALKVMERRARLLGLDAAQKVEHSGKGGGVMVLPALEPEPDEPAEGE